MTTQLLPQALSTFSADPSQDRGTVSDYTSFSGAEDDELSAVLAQIQQLEEFESEQLAWRLQFEQEFKPDVAADIADPVQATSTMWDTEVNGFNSESEDLAMAWRLAKMWEKQDQPIDGSYSPLASAHTPDETEDTQISNAQPDKSEDSRLDQLLLEHRELFVGTRPCTRCCKPVAAPRGDITFSSVSPSLYPPDLLHLLHAPCKSCNANHCRGCFRTISCPLFCRGQNASARGTPCHVLTCCSQIRAVALFVALCAFDRMIIEDILKSEKRATDLASKGKAKASVGSIGPGGTGYGVSGRILATVPSLSLQFRSPLRGKGKMVSESSEDKSTNRSSQFFFIPRALKSSPMPFDQHLTQMLILITMLLPSSELAHYDLLPHASIIPLLALSQLPIALGTLLRNDSIGDWLDRSTVYDSMLGLLRRMADTEVGIRVLTWSVMKRTRAGRDVTLDAWLWKEKDIEWEETGGQALLEHIRKLNRHCQAFLTGVERTAGGNDSVLVPGAVNKAFADARNLCGDLIAVSTDIERTLGVLGIQQAENSIDHEGDTQSDDASPDPSSPRQVNTAQAYAAAHSQLSFAYISLYPYEGFFYNVQVTSSQSSTRKPADRLHMVKELATMSTCLPEGIWVRVDDVRCDVIKVLIAGPADTPYANGLFEFDCFLPLNYPHSPPLMHLRTTGGGSVRFNPNLYNCGKVCLSLLGTWSGRPEEGWNMGGRGKSTLLQVLVSIQSMIFVEAPWFNEPGRGTVDIDLPASISHNKYLRIQTVRWAMLDWMGCTSSIWKDVITSHFLIRKEGLKEQVRQWALDDPAFQTYADGIYYNLLEDIEEGLARIEGWASH